MFRRRLIWNGTPKAPIVDGVPVANVGDIAYKAADGKIKTIAPDLWDSSLGTAVGVVVIPSGFAPDNGLARIINLNWTTGVTYWPWSKALEEDTGLINYTRVPITDNTDSTTTDFDTFGYMPSDKFNDVTSYVDPTAKYYGRSVAPYIPSPYLGVEPNPAYYAPVSGYNNALADFDGKGNTDVLVGLGTSYTTAIAARNYKAAGAEEIEWYLPAAGELGYLIPRFNKIQAALTKVNALQLMTPDPAGVPRSTPSITHMPWNLAVDLLSTTAKVTPVTSVLSHS